ncbi:MAG: thiamine pyrophosphate-binding protein [Candidatus Hydrogenedentota bacterium]|nr:MAG: thiamine pyrophosphate-binding protein [Candidatus Hydrogenedentota bacterium]
MESLKGGHALVKALRAHGVEYVFGIPGSHILSIYDGLIEESDIKPVLARHEQGAAFMADGYARVSRKPGVVLVTAGPGVLNAMTGMLEAYHSSSPVMLIGGEVDIEHLGREWGALHELKNQIGILESVTKWRRCITDPSGIPAAVHEAFHQLYSGCPKPVALSIPYDVLDSDAEFEIWGEVREMERVEADEEVISHVVDILIEASAPAILAGWGAAWSDGGDEIRKLSEILECPIITTERGKGVVSDDHPNVLGSILSGGPVLGVLGKADSILALGTRFDEATTFQWRFRMRDGCSLIHIDINRNEIGKIYPVKLGLSKDVRTVLRQILKEIRSRIVATGSSRLKEFERAKKGAREKQKDTKGLRYVDAMANCLPEDAIVVSDTTIASAWTGRYLPMHRPCSYLGPDGSTTMGFALPAAVGAKLASPERPVVAVCGDGGFMFTAPELATAVQHGVKVIVVVFNDGGYGWIRFMQDMYFGRRIQSDLVNPDFTRFAESFGVEGVRVDSPGGLLSALSSALGSDSMVLIEVADDVGSPY